MLTLFKKIFIWWNQDTLGTKLKTIFSGKLVGIDSSGNKYYESKKGKRWVIYNDEIDASKIPNEWYSWIHFTKNKIENTSEYLAIFKTITKNKKLLKQKIKDTHPYDVPEIAEIDVTSINKSYLKWLIESTD